MHLVVEEPTDEREPITRREPLLLRAVVAEVLLDLFRKRLEQAECEMEEER